MGRQASEVAEIISLSPDKGYSTQKLLTEEQVAHQLSITTNTLRKWRWLGKGPAFIKIGAAVRYEADAIAMFIKSNIKTSTSEA